MRPRVSVIMPVHNGENYLEEAVESILNQTFSDFEFIIIDDGSSDSTPHLLAESRARDPRIIVYSFAKNRGLSSTLNFGIYNARGEYIARMDADDISLSDRLEKQVAFMDAHQEIGVCSTGAELIGQIQSRKWQSLTSHDAIHARMLFVNAIAHPTVILRTSMLHQHKLEYDPDIRYAQDYELWSRAITKTQFANIPQILLKYRIHASQIGVKFLAEQLQMFDRIYHQFFAPLGIECLEDQLVVHRKLAFGEYITDASFFVSAQKWLETILYANRRSHLIDAVTLENELATRWDAVCDGNKNHPFRLVIAVLASPLRFKNEIGMFKLIRLFQSLVARS